MSTIRRDWLGKFRALPSDMLKLIVLVGISAFCQPHHATAQSKADLLRGEYGRYRANSKLVYYHLDVRVDPEKKTITGKNTIRFKMLKNDNRIQLDLHADLAVDKILLGETKLKYERELGAVFVDFPETLKTGRDVSIDFYYSGTPVQKGRFGGFTFGKDPKGRHWIYTSCEIQGASVWWPNKDQWRDKVESMDISVTIPNDLVDVSNGKFVGKKDLGDGYTRWDWHVSYPINNYNVSLNIGAYKHFSDKLNDLDLDFYALPEDLERAKKQFAQAKGMLEAFQHYFGEYPFKKDGYKLIQVPYSGMEHQSAVTYGNGFTNGYLGRDWTGVGISPRFDFIIIHESGHEWFGNSVSAADRSDMWIHEGWTTYLESLYVEHRWGKTDALKYLNGYQSMVKNQKPILARRGINVYPPGDQYFKGALFINTLRSVVDDDKRWFTLLRDFYQHFKYQTIMTEDIVEYFNKQTGKNLTPIFDQYLRHAALPVLELKFADAVVSYRWKAEEKAFAMPIRVGAPDNWQIITPTTTHWQTLETPLGREKFKVATDLYYVGVSKSQEPIPKKDAAWLLPVPEVDADTKVPTLAQVVGHRWGQDISSHAEIERYLHSLAKACPERCRLTKYGQSYQGKDLYTVVISSAGNMKRLEAIRKDNLALADSRTTSHKEASDIAATGPVIVWLAYCVHGNEASPSDAAMLTAYHLLADRRAETRELLEKVVIVIDPLQNPDGRDRFVNFHRETRGGFDQDHPLSADRLERWPGGRFNHYLFDMNRDWYLHTQKESAARVAAFLKWKPQIFVDAHEMGPNSTFFFDPSTEPYNPHTLARQKDWHMKIGRTHGEHFDRHGFAYTTREMFDGFGPQYGSTWPIMHGSIGILWEQAGVRGRIIARQDQTKLYYHDGVRHHYISALATLEAAAKHRRQLLLDFHANVADSVKRGETGPIRAFFLLEGKRPTRAAALAQLLVRNGIEVGRLTEGVKANAADIITEKIREHEIPAGSYCVPLNQPAARLALTLLERHQEMGAAYVKRQEDRVKRGLPDEIYDSTSWSLPLAFDVPCLTVASSVKVSSEPYLGTPAPGKIMGTGKRPRIGYMLSGDDDCVLPALCRWLGQGLRVHVFSQPTKVNGMAFPRGSLLLRIAENPEGLHDAVAACAKEHGVVIHAVDNAFVEEGASLGGPNVHWVKPPRILLMTDRPASHSVGHTWYLFDQVWRYPVTRIAGRSLPAVDWSAFDVCILPHGTYTGEDAPSEDAIRRMKDWVHGGGTLILVGGASAWATKEKVKLLDSKLEYRKTEDDKKDEKSKADKQLPLEVPGVFLRATVDTDHFTTWGMDKETVLYFSGNRIFTPLKASVGKNLVTFAELKEPLAPPSSILVSGYCWLQTMPMLPGKPYVLHQSLGRGHIIAFADDPNYRAFSPHLQRLFFNAAFFGPAR